jgi:hypothetical protein
MVDLKWYFRLYPDDLCHVEKSGENFVVLFKRFDNETGVELPPEPNYISMEDIMLEREGLTQKLEALNSIIADIEKL